MQLNTVEFEEVTLIGGIIFPFMYILPTVEMFSIESCSVPHKLRKVWKKYKKHANRIIVIWKFSVLCRIAVFLCFCTTAER